MATPPLSSRPIATAIAGVTSPSNAGIASSLVSPNSSVINAFAANTTSGNGNGAAGAGATRKIRLTTAPHAVRSYAVLLFCQINGIEYDVSEADLATGEIAGRVRADLPTLDDGGFILKGCYAILRYLSNKHATRWYPTEPQLRAQVDSALESLQGLHGHLDAVVCYRTIKPVSSKNPILVHHQDHMHSRLLALQYQLSLSRFLAGNFPSIADIAGACELLQLNMLKGMDLTALSDVVRWVDEVAVLTAPHFLPIVRPFVAGGLASLSLGTIATPLFGTVGGLAVTAFSSSLPIPPRVVTTTGAVPSSVPSLVATSSASSGSGSTTPSLPTSPLSASTDDIPPPPPDDSPPSSVTPSTPSAASTPLPANVQSPSSLASPTSAASSAASAATAATSVSNPPRGHILFCRHIMLDIEVADEKKHSRRGIGVEETFYSPFAGADGAPTGRVIGESISETDLRAADKAKAAKFLGIEGGADLTTALRGVQATKSTPLNASRLNSGLRACQSLLDIADSSTAPGEWKVVKEDKGIVAQIRPELNDNVKQLFVVAKGVVDGSADEVANLIAPLERWGEIDSSVSSLREVEAINTRTKTAYIAFELKRVEKQGLTRTGRFDFFMVSHLHKMLDGAWAYSFTSIPDVINCCPIAPRYARGQIANSGWVIRPIPASASEGPKCRVFFVLNMLFPARVSGWVINKMTRKALRYIERVRALLPAHREAEARTVRNRVGYGHGGSGMMNGVALGQPQATSDGTGEEDGGDEDDTDIVWANQRPPTKGGMGTVKGIRGGPPTPSSTANNRVVKKDKR